MELKRQKRAGRPKKNPKLKRRRKFLKYTDAFVNREAKMFEIWLEKQRSRKFVWVKEFAISRGYHPDRLADFAKRNKIFHDIFSYAKQMQEGKIVKGSLKGDLHATFGMFLLKCKHGYNDGNVRKIEVSGRDGKAIESKTEVSNQLDTNDADRTAKVLGILSESGALESRVESIDDTQDSKVHQAPTYN